MERKYGVPEKASLTFNRELFKEFELNYLLKGKKFVGKQFDLLF